MTPDAGVHNVLVLVGQRAPTAGSRSQGGDPDLDELLVTHDRAVARRRGPQHRVARTCVAIKFFGPDVNPDVPMIERR